LNEQDYSIIKFISGSLSKLISEIIGLVEVYFCVPVHVSMDVTCFQSSFCYKSEL